MKANDGGLAFPECVAVDTATGTVCTSRHPGMSLRDYFAGQALTGVLANTAVGSGDAGRMAQLAYSYADAMLKAREASHD